jgi:hypothetical protein
MKRKRHFGFKADDDEQLICRRILLNTLTHKGGSAPVEKTVAAANKQFGFSSDEVWEAAEYWNLTTEERDGVLYWCKPNCLVALKQWSYSRRQSAPAVMQGGSAA